MKNNEGYIEIEYRIAVILNESGLIRNTYSNILPNLSSLMNGYSGSEFKRFEKRYTFVPFTRTNLSELFLNSGVNTIESFDALFICTNATNDSQVLNILESNKEIIEEFIKKNKGLFVGSQKKLSEKTIFVKFLPESLSFKYITRPEEKSSQGYIYIQEPDDCLVAGCEVDKINYQCHNNRFKDHVYRSYMEPQYADMFQDVFVDKDFNDRKLFIRAKQYKVVYSTVSLDYEEQNDVLKNIIQYITEGISNIAFFADIYAEEFSFSNKYNSLLLNALLNKISISIYKKLEVTDVIKTKKIFVVSSEYNENEVKEFWKQIQLNQQGINSNLKKLIYLNESSDIETIVTEYKNYSEIDLKLKNVILWIENQIRQKNEKKIRERIENKTKELEGNTNKQIDLNKRVWGVNFWTTYDIMCFIFEMQSVYGSTYLNMLQSYGMSFFETHIAHYRDAGKQEPGSYDGMLNCSCALLELFALFDFDALQEASLANSPLRTKYDVDLTIDYIKKYIESSSSYLDYEMVLQLLFNLKRFNSNNTSIQKFVEDSDYFNYLLKKVIEKRILIEYNFVLESNKYVLIRENYRNKDLQELCKDIEVMAYVLVNNCDVIANSNKCKIEKIIIQHLLQIKALQTNGYWVNFNRTSAVLKMLAKIAYEGNLLFYKNDILNSILSQIIMSALNYILKEIDDSILKNQEARMWLKDLEATVTLSTALCLYNKYNRTDISKIESVILNNSKYIMSSEIFDNSAKEISSMRFEKERIVDKNRMLTQQLEKSVQEKDEYRQCLEADRKLFKSKRGTLVILLIMFVVIAFEEAIVLINHALFNELFIWAYSLIGTIIAFGISILLDKLIKDKLFPSDEKLFKSNKKKRIRKNDKK